MTRPIISLSWLLPVALLLATLASADDGTSAPECALYSLEGLSVGMPLARAQAAIPDAKWKHFRAYRGSQESFQTFVRRNDRTALISLSLAAGAVSVIQVDYLPPTGKAQWLLDFSAEYSRAATAYQAEIESELIASFGAPTWKGGRDSDDGRVPRDAWISVPCDRVVLLRSGRWGKGHVPVLVVRLERASTWQAALDARAALPASHVASAPARTPEPTNTAAASPGCSARSLFGISLGMSLSDAQAVTSGAKWWTASQPILGRQYFTVERWSTCPLPRARFILWFSGGALDEVEVRIQYRAKLIEERATQLAALERDATERFGAPASRAAGAEPDGLIRSVWADPACDRILTVKHGVMDTWYGPSTRLEAKLTHSSK